MSWDLEMNSLFKNMNAPFLEPWETEIIPIDRRNPNEDDEYVDIMTCENSVEPLIVADPFEESSGSFGYTDNTDHASFGDPEVESRMYTDTASSSMRDDWDEPIRQRKKRATTAHWRRFISPVMTQCKWIELKLKKLQSRSRKYEKELAELDHEKQFDYAHLRLDGCEIKSVPISFRRHRNKVMKRKKREGVEKNCDLGSNHPLFSYNGNVDGLEDQHEAAAIGGDCGNMLKFELEDVRSCVGNYDDDKSWDDIFQKVIAMEAQLQNLKSRHDKIVPDIEAADRPRPIGLFDNIDEDLTQYHELAKMELHELETIGNEMMNQLESIKDNAVHNVNVHSSLKSCSTSKSNIPKNKRKREHISGKKKRSRISR